MNIPLFRIHWDQQDIEHITAVVRRGMHWAIGPEIKEFERRTAEYLGAEFAVAMNSGTSALHAVLIAHGIGEGDEVIVPAFTFIATANAPLFVGAKPVFAEIEETTYGLDPADVERRITPKTKAIMPIHYAGLPCHIEELRKVAHKHRLLLIEDAAESFGATVNGRKVGTFGDSAILSFCANKVITTGEGGMVITDSRDVHERVKLVCSHGRVDAGGDYFSSTDQMEYITLGYNFRMSTMTAALGIAQMDKIDEVIRLRRQHAHHLTQRLSGIEAVTPPQVPHGSSHVYQIYTIRLKDRAGLRDKLMRHILDRGIMTKVYFHPVHLTRFYRSKFGYKEGDLPLTERIASEVLTLPMYPTLTEEEIDYVAQTVRDFFAEAGVA